MKYLFLLGFLLIGCSTIDVCEQFGSETIDNVCYNITEEQCNSIKGNYEIKCDKIGFVNEEIEICYNRCII